MSRFNDALRDQLAPAVERVFFASGFTYAPKVGASFTFEAQLHQQGQDYRLGEVGETQVMVARLTARSADIASITRYDTVSYGGVTWEVTRELWRRGDLVQLELQRGIHTERLAEPDSLRRI